MGLEPGRSEALMSIPTSCRRNSRGFTLFEFSIAALVLSAVAIVFYQKMLLYQEQSEKAAMERTVSSIESALRMRHAQLFSMDRAGDVAVLAEDNPINWLITKPTNYIGVRNGGLGPNDARGVWYFDANRKVLVYAVKHDRHLKYPAGEITFRLVQHVQNPPKGSTLPSDNLAYGVSFGPVEAYRWL